MSLAPADFHAHLTRWNWLTEGGSVREVEGRAAAAAGCSVRPGRDFASLLSLWSSGRVQIDRKGFGCRTDAEPTALQTVMWQRPCGPNIWIWSQIILQRTSCHLSLDKPYWSLTINWVAADYQREQSIGFVAPCDHYFVSLFSEIHLICQQFKKYIYHASLQRMQGQRSSLEITYIYLYCIISLETLHSLMVMSSISDHDCIVH